MTHLESRILTDILVDIFALWIILVLAKTIRDSLGRRNDFDHDKIEAVEKLPKAPYKDFNLLEKAIMALLPTHLWRDHQPDDDDLKILSMTPLIMATESEGITYKLYRGRKVLIKRVKLHQRNSSF
jgi:hypothetical protein